eukprot:scaffold130188_cov28-Tisochrysis_lutea.AAC.2
MWTCCAWQEKLRKVGERGSQSMPPRLPAATCRNWTGDVEAAGGEGGELGKGVGHGCGEEGRSGASTPVLHRRQCQPSRPSSAIRLCSPSRHASVVRETVALLSSYHNEVSESLAAKRESVTLEKQCLVQGATNGPELIGPPEIDARARVSPSKLPLSPGMQRRNSFVGDSSTSLPVSHGSVMDRPGSSPPVSPSQRASFGIGFSPYQCPYTPPPLIPGKPRTARA